MANINKKTLDLLNKQVNIEFGNAALYRQLSGAANKLGFLNTEKKLKDQYEDELTHFNKIFEYILDRDYTPEIKQIAEPAQSASSLNDIFNIALKREQETTDELKKIRQSAINDDDQLTEIFMNELIHEQIEEESKLYDILAMLKAAGSGLGEFMVDAQLED